MNIGLTELKNFQNLYIKMLEYIQKYFHLFLELENDKINFESRNYFYHEEISLPDKPSDIQISGFANKDDLFLEMYEYDIIVEYIATKCICGCQNYDSLNKAHSFVLPIRFFIDRDNYLKESKEIFSKYTQEILDKEKEQKTKQLESNSKREAEREYALYLKLHKKYQGKLN